MTNLADDLEVADELVAIGEPVGRSGNRLVSLSLNEQDESVGFEPAVDFGEPVERPPFPGGDRDALAGCGRGAGARPCGQSPSGRWPGRGGGSVRSSCDCPLVAWTAKTARGWRCPRLPCRSRGAALAP